VSFRINLDAPPEPPFIQKALVKCLPRVRSGGRLAKPHPPATGSRPLLANVGLRCFCCERVPPKAGLPQVYRDTYGIFICARQDPARNFIAPGPFMRMSETDAVITDAWFCSSTCLYALLFRHQTQSARLLDRARPRRPHRGHLSHLQGCGALCAVRGRRRQRPRSRTARDTAVP
jgi:hypothetical protein